MDIWKKYRMEAVFKNKHAWICRMLYGGCLLFYLAYPHTSLFVLGSAAAYLTVLQPAVSYWLMRTHKGRAVPLYLTLLPAGLFLTYAVLLRQHDNSNYGYSILFALGAVICLLTQPKGRHRTAALCLAVLLLLASAGGLARYLWERTLPELGGHFLFALRDCRLVGKSVYADRLTRMQYGDAPFAWMLHRLGVVPTIGILLLYLWALVRFGRRSAAAAVLAGTIGVQLALALCYSFLPQAAPLCIYLRVMIPFVTWGKGAPAMCLALWPLSRPEKERACID